MGWSFEPDVNALNVTVNSVHLKLYFFGVEGGGGLTFFQEHVSHLFFLLPMFFSCQSILFRIFFSDWWIFYQYSTILFLHTNNRVLFTELLLSYFSQRCNFICTTLYVMKPQFSSFHETQLSRTMSICQSGTHEKKSKLTGRKKMSIFDQYLWKIELVKLLDRKETDKKRSCRWNWAEIILTCLNEFL